MGYVSPGVLGTWGSRLQRCLPPRPKQERMSCKAHLLSFVIITRCSDWQLSIEPQHVNLICPCKGPSRTRCPRRPTQWRQTLCPQRKQAPLAALPPPQCCSSWEPSSHAGNPKSHSSTKLLRKAFSKNQLQWLQFKQETLLAQEYYNIHAKHSVLSHLCWDNLRVEQSKNSMLWLCLFNNIIVKREANPT